MKVIYTESAREELQVFHTQQREMLENIIKGKKYVFGDDTVEITASDIRDASRYIQAINIEKGRSTLMRNFFINFYLVMGILIALFGLFYPTIKKMLHESPAQVAFVASGTLLIVIAMFVRFLFKYRDERTKRLVDLMLEKENFKDTIR